MKWKLIISLKIPILYTLITIDWISGNSGTLLYPMSCISTFDSYSVQSINRRVWHRGKIKANGLYARMHKAARHLTLKCRGAAPTAFMRVEGSAVSMSITHAQGFALCPLVCARGRTFDSQWVWRLTTFQGCIMKFEFFSYSCKIAD